MPAYAPVSTAHDSGQQQPRDKFYATVILNSLQISCHLVYGLFNDADNSADYIT
jgi:hypothetical protein